MAADDTAHKPRRKKKYCSADTQCIPVLSAAFAAILTEGKTVEEVESLALFTAALANDLFLIAGLRNRRDLIFDDITII